MVQGKRVVCVGGQCETILDKQEVVSMWAICDIDFLAGF
jgi:hypothetical protein